ncbi:MAG: (Fe-S)-binding protein [Candidatus Methanomethyliaceae archaeon]
MLNYKDLANQCILCGICAEACPFYLVTNNLKYGAMAKVEVAQRLFRGEVLNEEDLKTIFMCTRCDYCHNYCPYGIEISTIIQGARAELRKMNRVPEKYKTIAQSIIDFGSPMAAPREKWLSYIPQGFKDKEKAKYLYFPGCWAAIRLPETAKASMELLIKTGIDFTILNGREWCCGLFLIDTGLLDEAAKLAEKNTLLFESTSAEYIITECPSCCDVFKNVYPKLFRKPSYEVLHISQLINKLLNEEVLKIELMNKRIIYKDPCPLVRRLEIIEEPRAIINKIAELVEYDKNKWEALCCGAPAGVKPIFPEIANKLAEVLINESKDKNADIAVGCVFCMYHMSGVAGDRKIYTLSQLLIENIKRG